MLLTRVITFAAIRRVVAVNNLRRLAQNTARMGLRYTTSRHSCLHLNRPPFSGPPLVCGFHGCATRLSIPTSWKQCYGEYMGIHDRSWEEAADLYIKMRQRKHLINEDDSTSVPNNDKTESEVELERKTRDILCGLGLVPVSKDENTEDSQAPILLPRMTARNIFHAIDFVTAHGGDYLKLQPLGCPLPAMVQVLGKRFGPLESVQKLFPLSHQSELSFHQRAAAEHRTLTAYLFYTALTPNDILSILSEISSLTGLVKASLAEYFNFLQLFLQLCECDDKLRLLGDGDQIAEEIVSCQARRVLMGRLKKWLRAYDGCSSNINRVIQSVEETTAGASTLALTEEQKRIVRQDLRVGEVMKVKAFAGTGKTRCMVEYPNMRPDKNFLYVTYGRNASKEAEKKFGRSGNVDCINIHALALHVLREMYPVLRTKTVLGNFGCKEIIDILGLYNTGKIKAALKGPTKHAKQQQQIVVGGKTVLPSARAVARVVNETLQRYCSSGEVDINIKSLDWVGAERLGLDEGYILEWARRIWDGMVNGTDKYLSHDAYFKLYHLQGQYIRPNHGSRERCEADKLAFGKHDTIIFDEAQDADSNMAEIVLRQRPFMAVILAGDPYQMIYGFRGANNECFDDNRYPPTYLLSLTHSFRFGDSIAGLNNILLGAMREPMRVSGVGGMDVIRRGFPGDQNSEGSVIFQPNSVRGIIPGPHAVIFRSNSALNKYAISHCGSHPEETIHLHAAQYMTKGYLFPLLRAAFNLYHNGSADYGVLRSFRSWQELKRSVGSRMDEGDAKARLHERFEAAIRDHTVDSKKKELLLQAMSENPIGRDLRETLDQILRGKPGPHLKRFLQAIISVSFRNPRDVCSESALVLSLEKMIRKPDFLGRIEDLNSRVVHPERRDTADITLTTAHQSKGSEWDCVEVAEPSLPYSDRLCLAKDKEKREEGFCMYVALTRAKKELLVGHNIATWLASDMGSYRFFLSRDQGVCPVCRVRGGMLIGYESLMETGRFNESLVIKQGVDVPPFGQRKDVIGCQHCVVGLYQEIVEVPCELARFCSGLNRVSTHRQVVGDSCDTAPQGSMSERMGCSDVFGQAYYQESERVENWVTAQMGLSWHKFPAVNSKGGKRGKKS